MTKSSNLTSGYKG